MLMINDGLTAFEMVGERGAGALIRLATDNHHRCLLGRNEEEAVGVKKTTRASIAHKPRKSVEDLSFKDPRGGRGVYQADRKRRVVQKEKKKKKKT